MDEPPLPHLTGENQEPKARATPKMTPSRIISALLGCFLLAQLGRIVLRAIQQGGFRGDIGDLLTLMICFFTGITMAAILARARARGE